MHSHEEGGSLITTLDSATNAQDRSIVPAVAFSLLDGGDNTTTGSDCNLPDFELRLGTRSFTGGCAL